MKIWVDDVRPAPEGYVWCKSVCDALYYIDGAMMFHWLPEYATDDPIELLDLDHDAGDFAIYGGDYINILDYLERKGWSFPIRLHTMNPVGRENMRQIIQKNGWTEVM